jgi:hypothetical protein
VPRLLPSVPIPCDPRLADVGRASGAARIGDIAPVAPTALPPVVSIQTIDRPQAPPRRLDLSA